MSSSPTRPGGGPRLWATAGVLVVGAVISGVAAAADSGSPPPAAPIGAAASIGATVPSASPAAPTRHAGELRIAAGSPRCIDDWAGGVSGRYTFDVANEEGDEMEIYLQDARSKRIYLEVENFGKDAEQQVSAVIPPGTYEWACITSYTIKLSRPFAVTGAAPAQPVHGITPVTPLDLRIPINTYAAWVRSRLPVLRQQVARLTADLPAGDVAAAKRDWLTAHLTYETLGAAYGAFGPLDDAINGDPRPDGRFEGFRKIESLLWAGRPPSSITPYATRLATSIGRLDAELAKPSSITPLEMGLRSHEILEDTLGKDLDGIGDAGSHTDLATVDANITGTWQALRPLLPLIARQDPYLARTQSWLRQTQQLVRSYHRGGRWVPLTALTLDQRAVLNAHVQQAVELLSHIPTITEPRDSTDAMAGTGSTGMGGTGTDGGDSK